MAELEGKTRCGLRVTRCANRDSSYGVRVMRFGVHEKKEGKKAGRPEGLEARKLKR